MSFPSPRAGMVIRCSYLWRDEHRRGLEEGRKDRPCAILLAVADDVGGDRVYVLPITHSPPRDPAEAVEVPSATKRRLGLDDEGSWVVLTEANRFIWPGYDLRPAIRDGASSVALGELPADLFRRIRDGWLALAAARRSVVTRS